MNKYLLSIICMLFLSSSIIAQEDFRKNPPKPGPAPEIKLGAYEQFTLDNGLQVITVENHKIPRVSFRVFVDVPLHLEGEFAGAASMAGQLLRTGTHNRTKAEIDEDIDFIGASFSTNANGMFAAALTKHQDKLLEVMSDVLFNPSFPQEELDKLKKQTISNLAAQKDDPGAIASNVSQVLRYGKDHPYGELTTEETVENISLEKCKAYYEKYFKPNISYLVIVGDINPMEAKTVAEKYFGSWERGEVDKKEFATPERPENTQVAFVDKTGAVQSTIHITYPIQLKPGTMESVVSRVLNGVLGSSSTARLFMNLREDKAYTYGAYSSINADPYVGSFSASADVRNEVTDSAIVEFLKEMKRIGQEPIPTEEIEAAKAKISGSFARSLESPQTVATFALNTARYNMPKDYYANYLKNLSSVSAGDVTAMARKLVTPGSAHLVVVGNKDEVADKLTRFDADGAVTFYDIYGNEIEAASSDVPDYASAEEVIDKYLQVIGTEEKLTQVEDIVMKMTTSMQGMTLEMTRKQKSPDKYLMSVAMNGNIMQQEQYDGEKGMVTMQGQKQVIEEEAQLEEWRNDALPFPEAHYDEMGYKLELKGVEKINGEDAFKVQVTTTNGDKITEFYSATTGYKVRTVSTRQGQGQTVTVTTDLADYKEVAGIMWPHTITVSGVMPMPLKMEVTSITVNQGIDNSEFAVE
jgi:zinc protease